MGDILPICFSRYKKYDVDCDGDKESTDSEDRSPCDLKKNCRVFRNYLREHNLEVGAFLLEKDDCLQANGEDGVFFDFCKKLCNVKKKRDWQKKDARRKGPSKSAKIAAAKTKRLTANKNKLALLDNFNFFIDKLLVNMVGFEFALAGTVPLPGKLYVADRSSKSGYVAIHVRSTHGRDPVLVYLRLRPASCTFDGLLLCTVDEMERNLSKQEFNILKPVSKRDKNFNVLIKRLDKRKLSLLGECVGKLVSVGVLGLKRGHADV
jgi:hypothetical protein